MLAFALETDSPEYLIRSASQQTKYAWIAGLVFGLLNLIASQYYFSTQCTVGWEIKAVDYYCSARGFMLLMSAGVVFALTLGIFLRLRWAAVFQFLYSACFAIFFCLEISDYLEPTYTLREILYVVLPTVHCCFAYIGIRGIFTHQLIKAKREYLLHSLDPEQDAVIDSQPSADPFANTWQRRAKQQMTRATYAGLVFAIVNLGADFFLRFRESCFQFNPGSSCLGEVMISVFVTLFIVIAAYGVSLGNRLLAWLLLLYPSIFLFTISSILIFDSLQELSVTVTLDLRLSIVSAVYGLLFYFAYRGLEGILIRRTLIRI
jgi:hypothetical protein